MMWMKSFHAAILLWLAAAAVSSDVGLDFISAPMSRLVKVSESRAVFRCSASPPSTEIRWLYKGKPIPHSIRWIRVSHHKLTVHLGRMEKSSPKALTNAFFQCELRQKGKVLVSAPVKLIFAVLDQFHAQPDVLIAAKLGNTAVIPCDPPYSVPTVVTEFTFNDTLITTSNERQAIMPSGDLQIFNVTQADSGEYRCIANNPFLDKKEKARKKVILHVEEPQEESAPVFIITPRSRVAVALGSNVTLECVASSYPAPVIKWKKHHGKLPHGRHIQIGGNLLIVSIRRGDEGAYYCQAENAIGQSVSEHSVIEIQETPQITKSPRSVSAEVGDNVTLNCITRGHPKPSVTWVHNGKTLSTSHKNKGAPLFLENVNYSNAGIYQCFATNALGTTYAAAAVTISRGNKTVDMDYDDFDGKVDEPPHHHKDKKHPDHNDFKNKKDKDSDHEFPTKRHKKHPKQVKLVPPSKPYITRLSNTSVMVRWNVPSNDGLAIHFFKVQYREVGRKDSDWMTIDEDIEPHIHSYAVTNLRTGGVYRFQIAAVYSNDDNKSGPVSSKFTLLKDPPMEKPSVAPVITHAEAESSSAIVLHWKYQESSSVPIQGFFIHYRATHTAGKYLKVTVLGSDTRSQVISHLHQDTGYDMKMQCFNDAGTSDFSNIYTSKTKPAENVPGSRKHKGYQSEENDRMLTESISSNTSDSNFNLYIIVGIACGVLLIAVLVCTVLFKRQKQSTQPSTGSDSATEEPVKLGNGYLNSNGYIPVGSKINISVNPLSHLDEESDKADELESMVSNNNEIIRLQTFSSETERNIEPLLNGSPVIESEFNGNHQADAVIVARESENV